jgi:hypothetical protein
MTEEERGKDGKFLPGNKLGGPKHKPHKIDGLDFWNSTEAMIREALKSKDEGNRLKAVNLYMKWSELKAKHEAKGTTSDSLIDPGVQAMLGDAVERLLSGDVSEVDDAEDLLDE